MPTKAHISLCFQRLALAFGFTALALGINFMLLPWLAPNFLALFLAAVALSTWRGNWQTGLMTLVLSTLLIDYFLLSPNFAFEPISWNSLVRLANFIIVASGLTWLITRLRQTRDDARKAYQHAENARAEQAFLAEASTLLASSMDYRVTLSSLAQLTAHRFCDWCLIDFLEADLERHQIFIAQRGDRGKVFLEHAQKRGFTANQFFLAHESAHTRTSLFLPRIDDTALQTIIQNQDLLAALMKTPVTSMICTPIFARGRVIAIMAFANRDTARAFHHGDLVIAEDLAQRSSLAMENALLYREALDKESALRASEARYRSLMEATTQIVWTSNAAGEAESDWPSWRHFTGQSDKEILGWGWLDAIHQDDQKAVAYAWAKSIVDKKVFEATYRLRRHDGLYRPIRARAVPVYGTDGKIKEWIGACLDLNETQNRRFEVVKS